MLTFAWEPLNHLLHTGIAALGARSWEECGNDKDVFEYDPDWARYGRMEGSDILRFAAVREDEELIGYASVIIGSNLHDRKVSCGMIQDIFIAPDKRRSTGAAAKLMDYVESQLLGIGVKHITLGERLTSQRQGVGKWLAARGYQSHERLWTKSLGARSIH